MLKELKNHINIFDFNAIQSDLDKLIDEIAKNSGNVIFAAGNKDEILPNFMLRTFISIENCINDVTAE